MSSDVERLYYEATDGLTAVAKMAALNKLMDHEDRVRGNIVSAAQTAPATQQLGSYATAATTGGYNSFYPWPTEPKPQPTGPSAKKKRKADNADERLGRADKSARLRGAQPSIAQAQGTGS